MFSTRTVAGSIAAVAMAGVLIVDTRAAGETAGGEIYSPQLDQMNLALAQAGASYRIDRAEISVNVDGVDKATTLIANNRTHQIESLFVDRDPRRGGSPNVSYLVDQSDGRALAFANPTGNAAVILPNAVTEGILDRAMQRWQNEPACPGPAVVKLADNGADPDIVDALLTNHPALFGTPLSADIVHAGWLPTSFFALLGPGAERSVLAVTFTLIFVDEDGNATDIDHNHRTDTAFREIYYNLGFAWSEGPSRPRGIDIDSVATHEAGHAFGLGHFGKVFLDNNGALKFSPRAIMNAVYVSPFTELKATDNASFCAVWAHRQ